MAPRTTSALWRWIHHRNSSDYRELQESFMAGCGVGLLGRSRRTWRTVPGLILDDEDESSIILQEGVSEQQDMICLTKRSEGRALRRNWASRSKQCPSKEDQRITEHHSRSKVMDSQSVETTETEDESEQEEQSKLFEKSVRWADCTGQDLAVTHSIDSLPYVSTRVVILLLDLKERIFEFVQCEFNTDSRLTISDVLKQVSSFASIDFLRQQRFRTLCRPDEEMINMLPIQSYHVREGEILVASGGDAKPKEVMAAASALLKQKKLVRAVHKAKLSGRALQRLMSSAELLEYLEKGRQTDKSVAPKLDESIEDQDLGDSALIVKVLSRELGEDLHGSGFADFSFPTFDADDDFIEKHGFSELEESREKGRSSWFDELLADSFTENDSVEFGEVELPDFQVSREESLESAILTYEEEEEEEAVDAFGTNSHAWSVEDVVVPDFSFTGRQFC